LKACALEKGESGTLLIQVDFNTPVCGIDTIQNLCRDVIYR